MHPGFWYAIFLFFCFLASMTYFSKHNNPTPTLFNVKKRNNKIKKKTKLNA
jgi:hypothetical protein